MRRINMFLSALSFGSLISGAALAADLDTIIPAMQEDPYVPVEVGSGWYIRGDISYDMATSAAGNYRTYGLLAPLPALPQYVYSDNAYDKFKYNRTTNISVGVGYQFNSFLRGDATIGSWSRLVDGRDTTAVPCVTSVAAVAAGVTGCRSEDHTKVTAYEMMANVYTDMGTFVGITPYLGAGVGVTHLKYGTLTNTAYCTGAAGDISSVAGCPPTASSHEGLSSYRMTYALMAGASYDISHNTKFDLGYRYSRVAGGNMFGFDAGSRALGATGVQGKDKGFSIHEIKAGIRYQIW
jgi:opacity protein-like surface antigen